MPQPFSPRYSGYPAARAQSREPASTQPWPLGATHPLSRFPSASLGSASAADRHAAPRHRPGAPSPATPGHRAESRTPPHALRASSCCARATGPQSAVPILPGRRARPTERAPELQSCGRGLPRPVWPGRPPKGPPRAAARPSASRAAAASSHWALRSAPFHLDFCRRGNFGFGDDLRSYWLPAGGVGGHGCSCYSAPRGAAKRLVSSQQVPSASPGSRARRAGRGAASLCK